MSRGDRLMGKTSPRKDGSRVEDNQNRHVCCSMGRSAARVPVHLAGAGTLGARDLRSLGMRSASASAVGLPPRVAGGLGPGWNPWISFTLSAAITNVGPCDHQLGDNRLCGVHHPSTLGMVPAGERVASRLHLATMPVPHRHHCRCACMPELSGWLGVAYAATNIEWPRRFRTCNDQRVLGATSWT